MAEDGSIADRARHGDGGPEVDEPQAEMFPAGVLDGDAKTLKTLIRSGLPVETTIAMRSAEVPNRGGLLDPERSGKVLVTFEPDKYDVVPVREGEPGNKRIASWKVRQMIRPTYVEGVDAATGDIEAAFEVLLDGDPNAAGALLDRLQDRARAAIA